MALGRSLVDGWKSACRSRERPLLVAVACGVGYGLASRLLFAKAEAAAGTADLKVAFSVMMFAFVVLVPIALGAWVVAFAPAERRTRKFIIFGPWTACVVTLIASSVTHIEGSICIVFMAPALLLCGTLGGVLAHVLLRRASLRRRVVAITAFALMPYMAAPIETLMDAPRELREVENTVFIKASPEVIWRNIKVVDEILPNEWGFGWTYAIGFPRPIAATLSHEGLGGVRHASFERQVVFVETIDKWDENRLLAFSIKADPIPATSLDEHVKVGGRYFDVLRGTYEILPQDGGALLKLSSSQRLSTHFNRYAALWSDWVMSDIQTSILGIIKNRCEAIAHG